jgi:hypothetical protein
MRRTLISLLAALAILAAAVPGRAADKGSRRQLTPEEVVALIKSARDKGWQVTVRLKDGTRVYGRVDEVSERGFTIVPYDFVARMSLKEENDGAEVLYEGVASVERESKVKRFFRKAGEGVVLGGVSVVALPVLLVAAALGKAPGC